MALGLRGALAGALAVLLAVGLAPAGQAAAGGVEGADGPERLIVLFHDLPPGLREQGHYRGAELVGLDEAQGMAVVQARHGQAFRTEAAERSEVRTVEPDAVLHGLGVTPNDPLFGGQYGPKLVGAPAAWSTTTGTSAATLCFLDSGVRASHQDLRLRYAGGIDLVNDDADPADDNGHGTRTAGVAAATIGNGVGIAGVANVPFKQVKVLDASGVSYSSDIATGLRWCADHGTRIVSISLGAGSLPTAVRDAVDYAWGKGLLVVAGSGNGGCSDCVLYPAAYPNVVAVGSVDANKAVSSFTSKGPQVDLAAPGVNVQTTGFQHDASYVYGGGTSLSAPHVAGAAALVWSAHPEWTNQQVRTALEATAQDVGPAGRDASSGAGLARADLAIAYGQAPSPTPSPAPTSTAYSAAITISPSSNEWWVQAKVTSSPSPSKVDVQVNGGSWQPMRLQSWGEWTLSTHAPKGSPVAFRATAPDGTAATSPALAWLGGSTSTTATSAPAFQATFTPKAVGNDWWVEVAVSSAQGVAKVEAKLGSGAYVALDKQSWGSYAKSLNAPNGTPVTFRATSPSGATATSATIVWT